jgi:predicted nucleic acid-binding protein
MSDQAAVLVRVVVTDTNILINLTHIGRLDLLGKLPPYSFVVPEEVVKEVKEPAQMEAIQTAISSGLLQVVQLTDPSELRIYAELIQFLGVGEAACLTLAQCRSWLIASDERRKFYRETIARLGTGRLLNTAGILIHAIQLSVITIEEADHAKALLEQRKFVLKFASFRDALPK